MAMCLFVCLCACVSMCECVRELPCTVECWGRLAAVPCWPQHLGPTKLAWFLRTPADITTTSLRGTWAQRYSRAGIV